MGNILFSNVDWKVQYKDATFHFDRTKIMATTGYTSCWFANLQKKLFSPETFVPIGTKLLKRTLQKKISFCYNNKMASLYNFYSFWKQFLSMYLNDWKSGLTNTVLWKW
jgi:hypothetical protein